MKRSVWISAIIAVAVATAALSGYFLLATTSETEGFLIADPDGDRMIIDVDPSRQEAVDALTDMHATGEAKWVGGEIETFENELGFRFKPDTIVVAEFTAEALQAVYYRIIQEDLGYWQGLGTVYVWGKVVATPT